MKNKLFKKITVTSCTAFLLVCILVPSVSADAPLTTWKHQCIDTMKISRDRARSWGVRSDVASIVAREIKIAKELGANCVAISTPYNDEFVPYLKIWSDQAHAQNLTVWFRGNFSEWEGWFEYPKNLTPPEHLKKTEQFILSHKDLFKDGDAFDSCPECEGVGPWKFPAEIQDYLSFKRDQREVIQRAFNKIGKKVIANRLAVIGGRAKDYYDLKTAQALGNLVVIDHYVKDLANMQSYVEYFQTKLKSKTFVGEFGAPIPDINGKMNEREQAEFVEEIYFYLYKNRDTVEGVNYWVLSDGTTALVNDDYTKREVAGVIEKYYKPGAISGTVKNTLGEALEGISIDIGNKEATLQTDRMGYYTSVVIKGKKSVDVSGSDYISLTEITDIEEGKENSLNFILIPKHKSIWYSIREFLKNAPLHYRGKSDA